VPVTPSAATPPLLACVLAQPLQHRFAVALGAASTAAAGPSLATIKYALLPRGVRSCIGHPTTRHTDSLKTITNGSCSVDSDGSGGDSDAPLPATNGGPTHTSSACDAVGAISGAVGGAGTSTVRVQSHSGVFATTPLRAPRSSVARSGGGGKGRVTTALVCWAHPI